MRKSLLTTPMLPASGADIQTRRGYPRVAVLNPLHDYGITAYTHEFAEGLVANGYPVDVFSNSETCLQDLPEQKGYNHYPILGRSLIRRRLRDKKIASVPGRYDLPASPVPEAPPCTITFALPSNAVPVPAYEQVASMFPSTASSAVATRPRTFPFAPRKVKKLVHQWVRRPYLSSELALFLRRRAYDVVWCQWQSLDVYTLSFSNLCKKLGLFLVHTAHNILPHETTTRDKCIFEMIYSHADLLVVHSRHAENELARLFPRQAHKSVVMHHGTYGSLHQRQSSSRDAVRRSLGIAPGNIVLLVCGGIRPYKNIDNIIAALGRSILNDITLVIAGRESKYPDSTPSDPLKRTRGLIAQHCPKCQVILLPRMLETSELNGLFEASDILLTPYLEGYGSGLLLMGITFGKHIVTTDTGGAREYFRHYDHHTVIDNPSAEAIAAGLVLAVKKVRSLPPAEPPSTLSWPYLTAKVMQQVEQRLRPQTDRKRP